MTTILSVLFAVTFLTVSATAAMAPAKTYRVGILGPPGRLEDLPQIKGLQDGLKTVGYGENLHLEMPQVNSYDELTAVVDGYVANAENVIVTIGGTATNIAKQATKDVPIVFIWEVPNPIGSGLLRTASNQQSNITGLSSFVGADLAAKRLELFKEMVPNMRRVAVLYNDRGESSDHAMEIAVVRQAAPKLRLKASEYAIKSGPQSIEVVASLSKQSTDGIFIIGSGLFVEPCEKLSHNCDSEKTALDRLPRNGSRGCSVVL